MKVEFNGSAGLPGTKFARSLTQFTNEAQPIRPEGPQDARLLGASQGCERAQHYIYNGVFIILHKSPAILPQDLGYFLSLASHEYRQALGYTDQQAKELLDRANAPPPQPVAGDGKLKGFKVHPIDRFYGGYAPPFTPAEKQKQDAEFARIKATQPILTCYYGLVETPPMGEIDQGGMDFWYQSAPPGIDEIVNRPNSLIKYMGVSIATVCPATYTEARKAGQQGIRNR
jgi:hypothetical protein